VLFGLPEFLLFVFDPCKRPVGSSAQDAVIGKLQ
jgi:hypothetical protein